MAPGAAGNSRSRRLARLGDALDKTYRITAIEETWVQVTGAGEIKTLRLGGGQPAAGSPAEMK